MVDGAVGARLIPSALSITLAFSLILRVAQISYSFSSSLDSCIIVGVLWLCDCEIFDKPY